MSDEYGTPPPAPIKPARRSPFRRISIVWIVPALALIAVIGVAAKTYIDKGPLIEITFVNASGIEAGTTELRFRDVAVGMVEKVNFSEGLANVIVTVRLHKDVADFVDRDARFWVVRPQVSAQGVTGLSTVLTGVFIEGLWDSNPSGLKPRFQGLEQPPLDRLDMRGTLVKLRAAGTVTLTEGTPILYRGISVGTVGKPGISPDGTTAEAEAIIFAPHDRLIDSTTRFWDVSGFSFKLGRGGVALDFSSIATLISGGVTFSTMVSGGAPLEPGATLPVYSDEDTARASLFSGNSEQVLNISAVFAQNIAGLSVDAPVEMSGLNIGRVSALNGLVDPEEFGDNKVRLLATLEIQPGKLGLDSGSSAEAALDFLHERVAEGLRARLATTSMLTGGLKVELTEVEDVPAAEMQQIEGSSPRIPTTESDISDVTATSEGLFQRISDLPIEEIMHQTINLLGNINALVTSEGVRNAPGNLNSLLADARGVITSDEVKGLPIQLSAAINQLTILIESLNTQELTHRLGVALDEAAEAAKGVNSAIEGVPQLIARIDAVAAGIEAVAIDKMADEMTRLLSSVDGLLDQQSTRALPASFNSALSELSAILLQLREAGVVETVKETLNSASHAADEVAAASADLPKLIEQARLVLARAATTLEGYQTNTGIGRDARDALREVQRAAQAVSSLAKAIERKPNSLLTGR